MSPASAPQKTPAITTLSASPSFDKRLHRRYPIALEVQYKLRNNGEVTGFGTGRTFNISSGGVLFKAGAELPANGEIELRMPWPLALDGDCPLNLVVQGRIVRSDSKGTAIRSLRHEFRTGKRQR